VRPTRPVPDVGPLGISGSHEAAVTSWTITRRTWSSDPAPPPKIGDRGARRAATIEVEPHSRSIPPPSRPDQATCGSPVRAKEDARHATHASVGRTWIAGREPRIRLPLRLSSLCHVSAPSVQRISAPVAPASARRVAMARSWSACGPPRRSCRALTFGRLPRSAAASGSKPAKAKRPGAVAWTGALLVDFAGECKRDQCRRNT